MLKQFVDTSHRQLLRTAVLLLLSSLQMHELKTPIKNVYTIPW